MNINNTINYIFCQVKEREDCAAVNSDKHTRLQSYISRVFAKTRPFICYANVLFLFRFRFGKSEFANAYDICYMFRKNKKK